MNTTGLVRVTVAAPTRRVDLALPATSPLAEILPDLLRDAGDHPAHSGVLTGGWTLRRADGTVLEPASTLAACRVADGEILSLLPTRTDWPEHDEPDEPEPEFDDLVEATAVEQWGSWGPRHTRWAGLAVGVVAVLLGLLAVVRSGPPWRGPGWWALGLAALALAIGVVLARGLRDAGAGTAYAAAALVCAFTGGGLLFADDRSRLLAAGAALSLTAVAGLLVMAGRAALLVAGAMIGLLVVLGGSLSTAGALPDYEAAAVVAAVGLAFSPLLESWSARLARLPFPVPPPDVAGRRHGPSRSPRSAVYAPVVRARDLLTGMIAGMSAVAVPCQVVLARSGDITALLLVAMLSAGFVLRARLHRIVAQRVALLVAGGSGAVCLAADPLLTHRPGMLWAAGPVLIGLAALAVLAGLQYSLRNRTPHPGGYGRLDVVSLVTIVPAACAVLGLYGSIG